jgi:hypothetical protein
MDWLRKCITINGKYHDEAKTKIVNK